MFSPFTETDARRFLALSAVGGLLVLVYAASVSYLLYGVDRSQTPSLLLAVALSVPGYFIASQVFGHRGTFALGLVLRVAAVFAFPLLSDDVYRFLWDGALWWEGIHPLASTPEALALSSAEGSAFAKTYPALLTSMNSPGYFTVYPPGSQFIFFISGWLASYPYWAIVLLKTCLLLGEVALYRQLQRANAWPQRQHRRLALYWLSPLVIVEICGNAHFEGLALLGVVAALYAWRKTGVGLARQGSYTLTSKLKANGTHIVDYNLQVGPGLIHAHHAEVPIRPSLKGVLTPTLALSAAVLVKLVPFVAAPAFALAALWRRSKQPVYNASYYKFAPSPYQEKLVAAARQRGANEPVDNVRVVEHRLRNLHSPLRITPARRVAGRLRGCSSRRVALRTCLRGSATQYR